MKLKELLEKHIPQHQDELLYIHDANSVEILEVLQKHTKSRFENNEVIGFGLSLHYEGIAIFIENNKINE